MPRARKHQPGRATQTLSSASKPRKTGGQTHRGPHQRATAKARAYGFQAERNPSDVGSEACPEKLCEGIIAVMGREGCAAWHVEAEGNLPRGNAMNKMGKHWTYLENKFGLRRWQDWGDFRVVWSESWRMLLQTAGEAHFRKSVWRWVMGGREQAEKQQGKREEGVHTGACEASKLATDPRLGLAVEERHVPRKSSSGLATDLIRGSRGLMPPGVYMPLTKALFPRDSLHVTFIATPLRRQRSFVDEGTERPDTRPESQDWDVTGLSLEGDQLASHRMTDLPTSSFCPPSPVFLEENNSVSFVFIPSLQRQPR